MCIIMMEVRPWGSCKRQCSGDWEEAEVPISMLLWRKVHDSGGGYDKEANLEMFKRD